MVVGPRGVARARAPPSDGHPFAFDGAISILLLLRLRAVLIPARDTKSVQLR